MGNYIYKKVTIQPLIINVDSIPDNTSEQFTTTTESLKEQIKQIEENNSSSIFNVTNIPISPKIITLYQNNNVDYENKESPSNVCNDISVIHNENSNEVFNNTKTPNNSPNICDANSIEEYKQHNAFDKEDILIQESSYSQKKHSNRTSSGLLDSHVEDEDNDDNNKKDDDNNKKDDKELKDFFRMIRDIML